MHHYPEGWIQYIKRKYFPDKILGDWILIKFDVRSETFSMLEDYLPADNQIQKFKKEYFESEKASMINQIKDQEKQMNEIFNNCSLERNMPLKMKQECIQIIEDWKQICDEENRIRTQVFEQNSLQDLQKLNNEVLEIFDKLEKVIQLTNQTINNKNKKEEEQFLQNTLQVLILAKNLLNKLKELLQNIIFKVQQQQAIIESYENKGILLQEINKKSEEELKIKNDKIAQLEIDFNNQKKSLQDLQTNNYEMKAVNNQLENIQANQNIQLQSQTNELNLLKEKFKKNEEQLKIKNDKIAQLQIDFNNQKKNYQDLQTKYYEIKAVNNQLENIQANQNVQLQSQKNVLNRLQEKLKKNQEELK